METLELDSPAQRESAAKPTAESPPSSPADCSNCGTPLLGPHCYACGQPINGMVRHFSHIIGDFLDTVFALDSRILRTLKPLLLRPGFLTQEYLAGRRVRYVSPVRLFVFLCLIAFFVAQLSTDWSIGVGTSPSGSTPATVMNGDMERAQTVEEVERIRAEALANLEESRKDSAGVPGVDGALSGVEQIVNQSARLRIAELQGKAPPPTVPAESDESVTSALFGDWDPEADPVDIDGFPESTNAWFTYKFAHIAENVKRIEKDPNLFKDALFGAIPSTLFVLLPIFTLLLSLLYLFKRRLYMEHMIVALHSHAFLSLAMLLTLLTMDLQPWAAEKLPLLGTLLNILFVVLLVWMPIYLLLMQKRVYGQGWPMTLLKFFILGNAYLLLLSVGAVITVLASLVTL
ncbi:DUF3667 domain-containing protein [Microbulbifer hainanensis]|uniref:DUF3667 domain-containing protein n=1 Tax=Microbulbifer hainanensis TaxID=2735675 RepID=UPI001866D8B9|nr:DUF3667 domain-containing protein [Microbulbifer hainanensis]